MSSEEADPPVLSLPSLVEALELGNQPPFPEEMILDEQLHVHHEEVVEAVESAALTVVLDEEVAEVVDLHPFGVILAEDVVAVSNHYADASNLFVAIPEEENPNPRPEEEALAVEHVAVHDNCV